jgi:hypothetical protein
MSDRRKFEIRKTKSETSTKCKRRRNDQNQPGRRPQGVRASVLRISSLRICFGFRFSDFGFRISLGFRFSDFAFFMETAMDTQHANDKRDLRLRKRILQLLHAARVRPEFGWVSGRFLYDVIDGALPGGQRFEDDDHLLGLLRDLIGAAYVEERDDRRREWERFGLDVMSYRVTPRGTALLLEGIPPDPLVEDQRRRKAE